MNQLELEQLLQPAIGYFELDMYEEANEEIDAMPLEVKTERSVLELQLRICEKTSSWQRMREIAGMLTKEWPDDSQHWIWLAYATRRCCSIAEAELILLEAEKIHPKEPLIHYNLACYAAQTGDMGAALALFNCAEVLDPKIAWMALEDPDLQPFWASCAEDYI